MAQVKRFTVSPQRPLANLNIVQQYEIQKAAWIWHPDRVVTRGPHVLVFRCAVSVSEETFLRFHVSADQRYELSLDGELVSRGPDRCDLFHWSFASYEVLLPAGAHIFSARAWWLGQHMPVAQVTSGRGGFIFAAEGMLAERLNTGTGHWQVARERGWEFGSPLTGHYHVIGSPMHMEGVGLHQAPEWVAPAVVSGPLVPSPTGVVKGGWRLYPSPLPDQVWAVRRPGQVRAIFSDAGFIQPADVQHPDLPTWQALIQEQKPIEIAPQARVKVLWDLGDYYCGYPELVLSRGQGAALKILWAEALFEDGPEIPLPRLKGDRNGVVNKRFHGFGDTVAHDGSASASYRPLWWRSGRYVLLEIACQDEPLVVESLSVVETRYPVENEGRFASSDPSLDRIIPLAVRGIQMCSHETFMDCPYYEQLMYVGDTRLEMLTTYTMSPDTALIKRGIELFDWSRTSNGFVAERYPSTPAQVSLTFSMIWVALLRDFAWWRDDPPWVQEGMVGMRNMLEHLRHLLNRDGLLDGLPGWSFVDWVPGWEFGMPIGARSGVSCVVNLFFVLALQYASDLERAYGDLLLAERNDRLAQAVASRVARLFWNEARGLLADDVGQRSFSEHAQCLALLTDALEPHQAEVCLQNLLTDPDLYRATVYFSFYLFEVLRKFERHDLLIEKLSFWKDLVDMGFKTPVEKPEPSRSDCHAWGSHPLFHVHASLAGVRPDAPGFRSVRIAPHPSGLTELHSRLPHPDGFIQVDLAFDRTAGVEGRVELPGNTTGVFIWQGQEIPLNSGKTVIRL